MKNMIRATLIRLVVTAAMALCMSLAFSQSDTTTQPKTEVGPDYVLGPEDVISVLTRDVSEASGEFLIRTDGKITFPLIGEILVAGLTTSQLENKLVASLKKELRDPQVTVNIKQLRVNRIYVLGAVGQPGVRDYRPGWRLTELISASNGLQNVPERLRAIIIRNGKTIKIELREIFIDGKEESNILILPGDVVSIQSDATIRINVIGPVGKPGTLTILEGQGAVEALAAASGEAQTAALSKAKIIRAGKEIPVNLYEAVKNGKSQFNVTLLDNDTLLIPTVDQRVAVMGQVKQPGSQVMPDGKDWTLSQALSTAGGPAQQAKLDGVTIIRKGEDGKMKTISVNYRKLTVKGVPSDTGDILLQDRDIVFIPQSGKPESGQINAVLGLLFYPLRLFGI
jgi:polysaccharide export outer membrane protein